MYLRKPRLRGNTFFFPSHRVRLPGPSSPCRADEPVSRTGGPPPSTEAIFRAAAQGDESARCVIDRALEYLTATLVSVLHIFDPEILIIGGSIAEAGPQLLDPVRDQVTNRTRILLGREIPILFQSLVGFGGVAGAAGLIFLQQGLLTI